MTADEKIKSIRVKVERAKQHLRDLETARDGFIASTPYAIQSEFNPQTGYDEFTVTNIQTPPDEIGTIVGDAIHNLRSALDHLAYQLVLANRQNPSSQTCFPIYDDAAKYNSGRTGKLKGMAQDAIDAIDNIKPYLGGEDIFWYLHKLDIADKHHALLFTITCVTEISLQVQGGFHQPGFRIPGFAAPKFGKPLKEGDVFFISEPGAYGDADFTFDAALATQDVIEGKPLIKLLQHMIDKVDNLIVSFKPFFE